ncbi:MAG: BREX system P-loop protein BrxC, partial [Rubrobacter sp.]
MRIRDLLKRDLSQKIEEIIQLDQADEHAVHAEITEYVATDSIKRQYGDLLEAINLSRTQPTSSVGVWVSGFFGSGKSSFAKNLGYILSNPEVLGHRAADLFKAQVDDPSLSDLVDVINLNMPAEVVMFDVQKDKSQAGHGSLSISPFVYRVLLRHLGYAEDFDLAELEISLEAEGKLDEFITLFDRRYAAEDPRAGWTGRGRKGVQVWNRAGVVLNEMDPQTYPAVESFAQSLLQNRVEVTPRLLVDRAFELTERRKPGKALFFIIDEVGQYVAYSQERLEDLRAVIELFGTEGRNRVRARRAPAQAWFIVTAQERLDEVTSAIGDDRRVLIAKVRDRFGYEVDLSPADVREVASRRVLSKKTEGEEALRKLFEANEGKLNTACKLERTSRTNEITEQGFVDFYPYLPHYINLSIDIMAGIRLQPGAMRHIGGSNRTIISQVYQMLVNNRTAFAEKPVGSLVALDAIYELIEGQVGSSKQKDIADIAERFKNDADDGGWALRVAKAVALLEFVRDLPRTEANIAAALVDEVDQPAPLAEVKGALERLVEAQFVRDTEEGYKLQTAQEKSWEQEKRGFDPRPKERKEIQREILAEIFGEPSLKTYKGLRTFSVGVTVDGTRLGSEGQVPLSVMVAEDEGERGRKIPEVRDQSRQEENEVYWVFALTPEIDKLVAAYYASQQMVSKYQQVQSLNKISNEEATSLTAERQEQRRLRSRLVGKLS